jgi:CRISPR-associated protein Csb2
MPFTIAAALPLGTYRAARGDGQPETVPSVARLYSALLCAAGLGPRSVHRDGEAWGPCAADEAALRWLEENPPTQVSLPALEVNRGRATAYRDDGTIRSSKGTIAIKKFAKRPDVSVAVDGVFRWTWAEDPPPLVAAALGALCPDVAYLGTTESPVRISVEGESVGEAGAGLETGPEIGATAGGSTSYVLDPEAGLFTSRSGLDVEVPLAGRLAELTDAHAVAVSADPPTPRRDSFRTDERSEAPLPPRERVALARYTPAVAPPADVPWSEVLILPLERSAGDRDRRAHGGQTDLDVVVPIHDRVRLAVTVHKALVEAVGSFGAGVPPLVTGSYPEGVSRPANRLAIQVLDASMAVDLRGASAAVALLIPKRVAAGDLELLARAVEMLRFVRGRRGRVLPLADRPLAVSGGSFWREPAPGTVRLWRTAVPAVPDTRGPVGARARRGSRGGEGDGTTWSFLHAALLSLGFVWKDQLGPFPGRGDERQWAVVDAVNAAGAAVVDATSLRDTDIRPWVHKVHDHAVVRPYEALLWLGDLGSNRTVQAIGQSRHLGGGLLVPVDLPAGAPLLGRAGDRREPGRRRETRRGRAE